MKIVHVTDIHLGHNKTPSDILYQNLRQELFPKLDDTVDVLFLGGDQADKELTLRKDGYYATCFIWDLRELAKRHKFFIRVLDGTESHDRGQNKMFIAPDEKTPELLYDEPLVKVHSGITIDRIEHLDLDVLYVAGTLPYTNALEVIHETMERTHTKQVDFILTHGYMAHLIPKGLPHIPPNTFAIDELQPLCKGLVLNGHVHTHAVHKTAINTGSFDRLAHGEENPKGFSMIHYTPEDGHCRYEFVENKRALKYLTFHLNKHTDDPDQVMDKFQVWLKQIVDSSVDDTHPIYIRIKGTDKVLIQSLVGYSSKYQVVDISAEYEDELINMLDDDYDVEVIDLPQLTEHNLGEHVVNYALENLETTLTREQVQHVLNSNNR